MTKLTTPLEGIGSNKFMGTLEPETFVIRVVMVMTTQNQSDVGRGREGSMEEWEM